MFLRVLVFELGYFGFGTRSSVAFCDAEPFFDSPAA
jgi:hypothetical protein